MDYQALKDLITSVLKKNGRGEITADNLREVVLAMVDSLGEAYPQNYTEEQKAQARANIDALSNHNGEITKEKLSAEVQAVLDEVNNCVKATDLSALSETDINNIWDNN